MDAIPLALFWALALWGLLGRAHLLLYLFFGSMPFGAFAVIPPGLTGGLTLTPTPMVVLLLILRTLGNAAGLRFTLQSALMPRRLLLLSLFWLVAILATLFMPRLFYGDISIIPVRLVMASLGEPLAPSTQNFSQLAYLSISVFAVFAFTRLLQQPAMLQHALAAICLGALLTLVTGLLDYASQYVALDGLLAPFRTASYALMTEVQIFGGKRVVGLMPEASAYGSLCMVFLCLVYFFRHAIASRGLRQQAAPLLVFALLLFTWLSTSSAAYVGLALFGLTAVIEWSSRKAARRRGAYGNRGLGFEFWSALLGLVGLALVILVNPGLLDPLIAQFDQMVFSKSQSSSYEERSMWTAVGWQALFASWGLGVGIGATRTSNFAAAIFSNTGLLGGLLYFAFVLQSLRRRAASSADGFSRAMLNGVRYAFLPPFVVSLLVATTADFGAANAFLFAVALAIAMGHASRVAPQHAAAAFAPLNTQPGSRA